MSKLGLFGSGVVLLGLGLGVTVLSYGAASSGGGSYFVATGIILAGLVRMVRGSAANDARTPEWNEQNVGRDGPPDPTPQLAGSKCVGCGQKILSALEAVACKQCNCPVHEECRKAHRREAHAERRRAPYR